MILVSVFLPYGQLSSVSLWGLVSPILFGIQGLGDMIPVSFFVMVVGFALLLMGGLVALFRHLFGGMLAVIGICFLSLPLYDALEGFGWLGVMGFGYYAAWAGAIICLAYWFLTWRRSRAKPMPEELELPPPPPPPDTDRSPAGDATQRPPTGLSSDLR